MGNVIDTNDLVKLMPLGYKQIYFKKVAKCMVFINGSDKKQMVLRLYAIKRTKKEIQTEEKRIKRLESKKQKIYSEETKFLYQYMLVIISLPRKILVE